MHFFAFFAAQKIRAEPTSQAGAAASERWRRSGRGSLRPPAQHSSLAGTRPRRRAPLAKNPQADSWKILQPAGTKFLSPPNKKPPSQHQLWERLKIFAIYFFKSSTICLRSSSEEGLASFSRRAFSSSAFFASSSAFAFSAK